MNFGEYKVSEINFSCNGNYYLMIYGKHINGYFCAFPGYNKSCEMSDPRDIFYNTERLCVSGFSQREANQIAKIISNAF